MRLPDAAKNPLSRHGNGDSTGLRKLGSVNSNGTAIEYGKDEYGKDLLRIFSRCIICYGGQAADLGAKDRVTVASRCGDDFHDQFREQSVLFGRGVGHELLGSRNLLRGAVDPNQADGPTFSKVIRPEA